MSAELALELWKAGGTDLAGKLRRMANAAEKEEDFLGFWKQVETSLKNESRSQFSSESTTDSVSDPVLASITKFRDMVVDASSEGVLSADSVKQIVSRLRQEASNDEEKEYWDAFEIGDDVLNVSREEMSTAVIEFLSDMRSRQFVDDDSVVDFLSRERPHLSQSFQPVLDAPSIMPILEQIQSDVAELKRCRGVEIVKNPVSRSTTSSSEFFDQVSNYSSRKITKTWKTCGNFDKCHLQ